jgi:hypothetical protein
VVNLVARPTSGALGIVVLPFQGASASVRNALRRAPEAVYRGPRYDMSFLEAAKLSEKEARDILRTFEVLRAQTKFRKREVRRAKHRVFLRGERVGK